MVKIYKWLLPKIKGKVKPGPRSWSRITSKPLFPKPASIHIFCQSKRGQFQSAMDFWRAVGVKQRKDYLQARGHKPKKK